MNRAMQDRIKGFLLSVLIVGATLNLIACTQPGQQKPRRPVNPAEVSSPLTSHTLRPELLAAINSLEIAKPSVGLATGTVSIDPADAQRVIEQAARETMTLKISTQGSASAGKAGSRTSTPSPADAMLFTDLMRFEQRQGSAFAGDPAVVSFKMSIKTAPAGLEVWTAQYFFRQEALSENLLRINERLGKDGLGAGWRTADEVFRRGVSAALQDFSNQREQRYLVSKR